MRVRSFLVFLMLGTGCGAAAAGAPRNDDGGFGGNPDLTPCQSLLQRVCGDPTGAPDARCTHTSTCEAARLTAAHEPERCAERDADLQNWTACPAPGPSNNLNNDRAQSCTDLLTKVCGPEDDMLRRPCDQDRSCRNALEVVESTPGQSDAAACREALGDDTSFPRCTPH